MSTRGEPYDVVFLGGGLASSLQARYLKREHPDLRILVLEKNTDTHHNPGESTVGVAGMFLIRDLGLSTYCYLNHLPKCGLRYFFDVSESRERDEFDVTACSEIGPNILPIIPTFQVDRKRLDRDLWDLNRQIGVEVETGCPVTSVEIGEGGQLHRVGWENGDVNEEAETRWVVNSLGRNPKVGVFDELSPRIDDSDHLTAAAWGRFTNTRDIDSLGDDAWRKRAGYTSRYLSTNHFMGRGFWIWAIPIGEGVVSWGAVYDQNLVADLGKREAFLTFLHEQPFAHELLEGAELVDFQSHPRLTFRRERFCSADGWATAGDGFGFTDPFYSPGSDVMARQAYLLEHLVTESDPERLAGKVALANEYTRYEYDLVKLLYVDQYNGFGSYELFNIKSLWDFHSYTNRLVWYFLDRKYKDVDFLETELRNKDKTLRLTQAIQNGFRDLATYLSESGLYERKNRGEYSLRQNRFRMEEEMLVAYDDRVSISSHFHLCKLTVSELLESRFEIEGLRHNALAQHALSAAALMGFELSEDWFARFCARLGREVERQLRARFGDQGLEVVVDARSFSRELPEGLETAPQEVRDFAEEIWGEGAVNPVASSLLGKPGAAAARAAR